MATGPGWKREGDRCITLSGSWSLLVDRQRRRRLLRDFLQLDDPHSYRWDLREVDALDSTGALILWKAWEGRLPELDCREDQRHLFERIAQAPPLREAGVGKPSSWLVRLGIEVLSVLKIGAGIFLLLGQVIVDAAYCVSHPRVTPWKEISANVYRIGVTSMPLLGSIGLLIGVVMTIQVGLVLRTFGAAQMVVTPAAAWMSTVLGTRRVIVSTGVVFALASLLAPFARDYGTLMTLQVMLIAGQKPAMDALLTQRFPALFPKGNTFAYTMQRLIEGTHPDDIFIPVSGAVAYRLIRDWIDWPEAKE